MDQPQASPLCSDDDGRCDTGGNRHHSHLPDSSVHRHITVSGVA